MQEAYSVFADVYDEFMDNIPYDEWVMYLKNILHQYNINPGALVCELGCGTGEVTMRLQQAGYDLIGIDFSESMLAVAREKWYERNEEVSDSSILYLWQDMRDFELYGTVGAIISVCDSMNYLRSTEELQQVLSLCNNYLDPDGIFVFDLKSIHYFKDVVGNRTISDLREDKGLIWENEYHEKERENEYRVTLFLGEEETEDGEILYSRQEELHIQKAFTPEEITKAVKASGMKLCGIYNAFTMDPADDQSERFYVVCQECQKQEGDRE